MGQLGTTVTMRCSVQSISELCFTGHLSSCFITFRQGSRNNKRIPAEKRTYINARDIWWEWCLITSQIGRSIYIHGQLALTGLSQPFSWTVFGLALGRILYLRDCHDEWSFQKQTQLEITKANCNVRLSKKSEQKVVSLSLWIWKRSSQ